MERTAKRRALGRGLGALIPAAESPEAQATTALVPVAAIVPNRLQPRRTFPEESIEELAESIRQKGMLQPLIVRRTKAGFELIAGERRLRAAQRLGMEHIPVTVRDATDGEMLEVALIENIQREDLNPLEEARAYRRLIDEFKLTQEAIATRVGKDRSTIANTLRLLQLPREIQTDIEHGTLSAGHARALAGAGSDATKVRLAREVVSRRLTVRDTERLAQKESRPPADVDQLAVAQKLTELLGARVHIRSRQPGRGKIEIEYYSLEELNGLVDRLSVQ
ncbi:MAG: ParB/RepB/Spo0J family partition protein [Candidatus Binatia bacterium]